MDRPITGFTQDDEGHWVALLSCGHGQHVRHEPPFTNRPWVTTQEGRASRLGALLNCVRCDAFEPPEGLVAYHRTPVFTEATVPPALTRDHFTKPGTWARIRVEEGHLRYHVPALGRVFELSPDHPGTVLPEVPHHLELQGPVRFSVEFYRAPDIAGPDEPVSPSIA